MTLDLDTPFAQNNTAATPVGFAVLQQCLAA
jgi:hypothetical protein